MRISLLSCLFGVFLYASPSVAAPVKVPVVAIIDSGVAATAELQPLIVTEYDLGAADPRPAYQPRYDHGTMVATILAREAKRNVRIVSIRIDDPAGCPKGSTPPCQQNPERIAAAIRQATKLGVDAINISLAMSDDPRIVDAVHDAGKRGISVVLAAGNDGYDHPLNLRSAKAAFPKAVLVGALDAEGQVWKGTNRPGKTVAGYNYRWQLGVNVPTMMANGAAAIATGTSFAAPIETARIIGGQPVTADRATLLGVKRTTG